MVVTVIRLDLSGELIAVTHCASLSDSVAVAVAHPSPGTSFLIEGREVAWLRSNGDFSWRLERATGCQIIRIHDALIGDVGLSLYRFTVRSTALERTLEVFRERHPAPVQIEELPTIKV